MARIAPPVWELGHLGRGGGDVLLGRSLSGRLLGLLAVELGVVLLTGAVDGHLDGDLTALDLLAVHLLNGLVLELLGAQSDKTEATALAALVTGLQLLDHEAGDGAQGNLGGDGLVVDEDLLEL